MEIIKKRVTSVKLLASIVMAFAFMYIFSVNAFAGNLKQIGNSDNSVTMNWEGVKSSWTSTSSTTYTYENVRIGYAEIPIGADYATQSQCETTAKNNATNGQIVLPNPNEFTYTIPGLRAQSQYIIYVAYNVRSTSKSGITRMYENNYLNCYALTKISKINNVAQKKWWKYALSVDVSWDQVPTIASSDVTYEVKFMDVKGRDIETKTSNYIGYSHAIKNNKIYTVKVRATRRANSNYQMNMGDEVTEWSDVQYLFTQPTVKYAKLAKGKLTISWNKIAGVTSYDVYVSTKQSKGYKKVKTLKAKKSSYTIKKFKKKKLKKRQYFVYVVPNKKVAGKVIKKDVTYVYKVQKGVSTPSECYK